MVDSVRVLYVDDPESAIRASTALDRVDARLRVETATSVDEALGRIGEADCVVSGYDLPERDGIELLDAIRERDPDRPVILFTDAGSEAVASEAISTGVTDYVRRDAAADPWRRLADRVVAAADRYRAGVDYRDLFEHSPDGIVVQDPDGSFVDMNDAYAALFGYDREEFLERGFEAIHPDEPPYTVDRARAQIRAALDERPQTFEWRGVRKDGERFWAEVHLAPIRLDGADRILATVRDVTERKERERELRRTDRRYRAIFNDPNILAGLLDSDGTVLDVNETAMAYVDASRDEVIDVPFWGTPWFAQADAMRADIKTRIDRAASGEYVDFEATLAGDGGETHAIEGVFRPVETDDEVVSIVVSAREVTERTERERELERIRDFFTEAERLGTLGAWEYGADGTAVWTDGTRRIHEVDDDFEPTVEAGLDFVHPDDRDRIRRAVEVALEAGEPYDVEARLITATGDTRWVRTRGEPVIVGDGESVVRGYIQDITERKEYERRLEQQNERLETFASVVSHDLRNPLTVAQGRLELARTACECDCEEFDTIDRAHERMRALIDDLLTLARQGDAVDDADPVDLSSVVRACWRTVDTTNADLIVDTDLIVDADRSRLQQLLENLIRNSVEHGSTGGQSPSDATVTITVGDLDGGFYVADDGPGIPEAERASVFEAGYTTREDGTGFGLSIVEQIVDAHGWTIAVTESDDGGTRFEITAVEPTDTAAPP